MRSLTVDRLLHLEPGVSARGLRNVTLTEDVFATHFAHFPVLPGVLVTDTMAQVAAWGSASGSGLQCTPRLVALRGAKFRHFVRPGDQLVVDAVHVRSAQDLEVWKATATVDGKRIATVAELEFVLEPVAPHDRRHDDERFGWAGGWQLLAEDRAPAEPGAREEVVRA